MNLKRFIIYSEDDIEQLSLGSQRGQSLQQRGAVARSREGAFQGAVLVSHAKNRTRDTGWFELRTEQSGTHPGRWGQAGIGAGWKVNSHPENTWSSLLPAQNTSTFSRYPLALLTTLQGLQTPPKSPQSPRNVGVSESTLTSTSSHRSFCFSSSPSPACSCWISLLWPSPI